MLEIILAAVLTLLGLLILVILIVRWTLCRRNVARISRINSEQCAGLLDNEDGIASARRNKAQSVTSLKGPPANCLGVPVNCLGVQSASSLAGNAGHITGTIGPITGATGPINLCQKTFVQTPGPFDDPSDPCCDGMQQPRPICGPVPSAICCRPPSMPICCRPPSMPICCRPPSMPNCPSASPIIISQNTTTRPGPPIIMKRDAGHTCGGPNKKSDAVYSEFNRESLKKKTLVGSNESFTSMHKTEMTRRVKSIEGARNRPWTGGEGRCDYLRSNVINQVGATGRPECLTNHEMGNPRQESQVRFDTRMENEYAPEAIWCEPPTYKRWECNRRNEEGILKRQDSLRKAEERPPVTWEPQYTNAAPPPSARPSQYPNAAAPPPSARPSQYPNGAAPPARPSRAEAPAEAPARFRQQGEDEYPMERKIEEK
ncbi:Testis-expressed basic protein 1 [Lemmus lemmus]